MSQAVRFERFGGPEVLRVVDVDRPEPQAEEVLVRVRATAVNPVESAIRGGFLQAVYPSPFPAAQGKDVAGQVVRVGSAVSEFAVGDEVFGATETPGTHAEYVAVPARRLARRPAGVPWEVAGSLGTAATAAYASVRAVAAGPGDVVIVAGAAGGVGSVAVQLLGSAGAKVIGIAGEAHHDWLRAHGVIPVDYNDGLESSGATAFIDAFGAGYVDLALALGVAPARINTLVNFPAVAAHGVQAQGSRAADGPEVLAELAGLVADGRLEIPVEARYALAEVVSAFDHLDRRHTLGKIVLTY